MAKDIMGSVFGTKPISRRHGAGLANAKAMDVAGKTWSRKQYTWYVGEPDVWEPTAESVDNDLELKAWMAKQVRKPENAPSPQP